MNIKLRKIEEIKTPDLCKKDKVDKNEGNTNTRFVR
jgi:hypothetical protein